MGYPRWCPSCSAPHDPPCAGTVTVERRAGGSVDPRRPDRPGPLLRLRCLTCQARYWWDFFADAAVSDPP